MIFVCSMSDLFHKDVPFEYIKLVFSAMAEADRHTFQVLTKRPERASNLWGPWIPWNPNIWFGITAENQEWWEKRRDAFFATPAAVHFLSYEPALGPLVLSDDDLAWLDWVICGPETGPGARGIAEFEPRARSLRDQCTEAGVPFFLKKNTNGTRQIDGREWSEMPV